MTDARTKINYKPLWKLLIDRNMFKTELREKHLFRGVQWLKWQTMNMLQ